MARFFISDTHFGHSSIRLYCQRPFNDNHYMNKIIIERWNSVVGPNDIVYHLGDFAKPRDKNPTRYIDKLNGKIILIHGNHDKKLLVDWFENYPALDLDIGGYHCRLQHRPYYPEALRNPKGDPFGDHKPVDNPNAYDFYLTGHIHNNYYTDQQGKKIGRLWTGLSLNLSVEIHDYTPVSEEQIIKLLDNRKEYKEHPTFQNMIVYAQS